MRAVIVASVAALAAAVSCPLAAYSVIANSAASSLRGRGFIIGAPSELVSLTISSDSVSIGVGAGQVARACINSVEVLAADEAMFKVTIQTGPTTPDFTAACVYAKKTSASSLRFGFWASGQTAGANCSAAMINPTELTSFTFSSSPVVPACPATGALARAIGSGSGMDMTGLLGVEVDADSIFQNSNLVLGIRLCVVSASAPNANGTVVLTVGVAIADMGTLRPKCVPVRFNTTSLPSLIQYGNLRDNMDPRAACGAIDMSTEVGPQFPVTIPFTYTAATATATGTPAATATGTPAVAQLSASTPELGGGPIAGIVIACVVGAALLILAAACALGKCKSAVPTEAGEKAAASEGAQAAADGEAAGSKSSAVAAAAAV